MRRLWWIAAVAAVAMVAQGWVGLAHGAAVARRPGFRVVAPSDGTQVTGSFLLVWQPGGYRQFAVTLDEALPRPGEKVRAGATTVITSLTALRLKLQPRSGGSPSARAWHRVVILPLDGGGRRAGEDLLSTSVVSG